MSSQPIPKISNVDVERIARREFGAESAHALEILSEYGADDWHKAPERVRVAALKLARGDIEALRGAIDTAKQDYRDVIAWAEYPKYMRDVSPSAEISAGDRKEVTDADWKQYVEWLNRPAPDD